MNIEFTAYATSGTNGKITLELMPKNNIVVSLLFLRCKLGGVKCWRLFEIQLIFFFVFSLAPSGWVDPCAEKKDAYSVSFTFIRLTIMKHRSYTNICVGCFVPKHVKLHFENLCLIYSFKLLKVIKVSMPLLVKVVARHLILTFKI